MKFCSECGATVVVQVPAGDHLPRHVCPSCHTIHYQNPRVIVGVVPVWEDRILLCRRAIEPRHGYWTIPAGFMENGETLAQGAAREAHEEALAEVQIDSLLAVIDVVHVNQVHMMFRGHLTREQFGAGAESLEVKLVAPDQIPWHDLAFTSVRLTLEGFLADRRTGTERLHRHSIA